MRSIEPIILKELDAELNERLKQSDIKLKIYKLTRPEKIHARAQTALALQSFIEIMKYYEIVWKEKNNKPSFLILKDTEILDENRLQKVSLDEVKVFINRLKIYD